MNNAGMMGYSTESTSSHGETTCHTVTCGCVKDTAGWVATDLIPSHGETMHGPLTREQMGHGEYATMWADDLSLVVVECYCGWRTRSARRLTAMERLAEHVGEPFSPELLSALARVA